MTLQINGWIFLSLSSMLSVHLELNVVSVNTYKQICMYFNKCALENQNDFNFNSKNLGRFSQIWLNLYEVL